MLRLLISAVFSLTILAATANAQIGPPSSPVGGTRVPTLQEVLVNNLRATLPEQQQFLNFVVQKSNDGKLDKGLVLALMRYSQRRNQQFPFPYFERAMRQQAAKRGVTLPAVATIVSSRGFSSR